METIVAGPERPGGQGLDAQQEESGNRVILGLLRDPEVRGHVDLVITCRDSTYEVWAERGMVRFQRVRRNGSVGFEIVESIGENPIERQDHTSIATAAEEQRAAANSGHASDDANRAFIEPSQVTYPHAYERIAQLFDSPFAPDIVLSPRCYTFGRQPGTRIGSRNELSKLNTISRCKGVVSNGRTHSDTTRTPPGLSATLISPSVAARSRATCSTLTPYTSEKLPGSTSLSNHGWCLNQPVLRGDGCGSGTKRGA